MAKKVRLRLEVKALPKRGFFRAGRYWPPEWVEVEVDKKTLEALEAEPMLSVRRVEAKTDKGE